MLSYLCVYMYTARAHGAREEPARHLPFDFKRLVDFGAVKLENLEWPAAIQRLGGSILIVGYARHLYSSISLSLSALVLAALSAPRRQNRQVSAGLRDLYVGFSVSNSPCMISVLPRKSFYFGARLASCLGESVVNATDPPVLGSSRRRETATQRFNHSVARE